MSWVISEIVHVSWWLVEIIIKLIQNSYSYSKRQKTFQDMDFYRLLIYQNKSKGKFRCWKKKVKRSTRHFLFSKFSIWIVVKAKLCCFWHLCPWCVWLVREWTPTSEPTYNEQLKPTVTAHSLQQFGVLHTTEEQNIYWGLVPSC